MFNLYLSKGDKRTTKRILLRDVHEDELPVLKRYFPREVVQLHRAKYLDIILYSKEQVQKENAWIACVQVPGKRGGFAKR